MLNREWIRWIMQTARTWPEISRVIKLTGIDALDIDHRRMTELALDLNKVIERLDEGEFSIELLDTQNGILSALAEYTAGHFAREERLMNLLSLEHTEQHRTAHRVLLEQVEATRRELSEGRSAAAMELRLLIMEWVVSHINEVDCATFSLEQLRKTLRRATDWSDVAALIQATGIHMVDSEHRDLVKSALIYANTIKSHDAIDNVESAYASCVAVARKHFDDEQAFMARCSISGQDEHKKLHDAFIEKLTTEYSPKSNPDPAEFKSFFLEWLMQHINSVDYRSFRLDEWASSLFDKVTKWEDISWLIRTTSIDELDKEHQALVEVILAMNQFMGKRAGVSGEDIELFTRLRDIAASHFAHEERIMSELKLTGTDDHINEHHVLLETVNRWGIDFKEGRLPLTSHLRYTLLNWMINHTSTTDFRTFNPESRTGLDL